MEERDEFEDRVRQEVSRRLAAMSSGPPLGTLEMIWERAPQPLQSSNRYILRIGPPR